MEIEFKNDSERLQEEWGELGSRNVALKNLVFDVASYVWSKYEKNIIITMIYRTDEEQDAIYADDERYQKKKFKSPHQFMQAVDLRSKVFTNEEIDDIVNHINEKFDDSNWYNWTAKCHDVGLGDHFHIQYLEVKNG